MKYIPPTTFKVLVLVAETVDEAGMLKWMCDRFEGKSVTLAFDTTSHETYNNRPAMWLRETANQAGAQDDKT